MSSGGDESDAAQGDPMSIDAQFDMEVGFSRVRTHSILIRALLANGWTANDGHGGIHYGQWELDKNGNIQLIDTKIARLETLDELLAQSDELERKRIPFSIELRWAESESTILISFNMDRHNPALVGFGLMDQRVVLDAIYPWTDHNWYLIKIIPPLIKAGFAIGRIRSNEG